MAANFKFNFTVPDVAGGPSPETCNRALSKEDIHTGPQTAAAPHGVIPLEAKEVIVTADILKNSKALLDVPDTHATSYGVHVRYCKAGQVEALLNADGTTASSESAAVFALAARTDLIPAVYEGGLKIWECSYDLLNFLAREGINFEGKAVIEVGCGSGLPGLYALRCGANVDFQDYNAEVIELVTIPNAYLNLDCNIEEVRMRCHFYCGDWEFVARLCNTTPDKEPKKYNIILTSETIYNPKSYEKLHSVFDQLLTQDGQVYIAAKSYYFGVGGSTDDFRYYVQKAGKFVVTTVYTSLQGVPREILLLKRCT